MRVIGQVLVLVLAALGQVGEDGWLGLLHRLACECCEGHETQGCCSAPAGEAGPVLAAPADGGCACAVLPSEPSSATPGIPAAGGSWREDQEPDAPAAWSAPANGWMVAARTPDPPPRVVHPAGGFDGFSRRLLFGSGGERSACLGSARA